MPNNVFCFEPVPNQSPNYVSASIHKILKSQKVIVRVLITGIWILGFVFLAWLIINNWPQISTYLLTARVSFFVYALLVYLLTLGAVIVGWTMIMRSLGSKLPVVLHMQIYNITLVARRLPGTIWYVGGRIMMYRSVGESTSLVAFASAIELFVTIMTGAVIGIVLVAGKFDPGFGVNWLLYSGIFIGILFSYPPIVRQFLKKAGYHQVELVTWRKSILWYFSYAMMWLLGGIMFILIVNAFQPMTADTLVYLIGGWSLSGALGLMTFFLPSTFGVMDISIVVFLSTVMPLPLAGTIAVVTRLLTIGFELLLAFIFWLIYRWYPPMVLSTSDATPPKNI